MESITKNRQKPDTVRAMVARAYGPDAVPESIEELGHGWFNVAYRIRLRDGADVVLKIAPPPHIEVMTYERGAMATELAALDLIRARTSVPVPPVHFADTSHTLCDADYFLMPYVEGDCLGVLRQSQRLSPTDRETYQEAMGALNRTLNSIVGDHFGPLTGPGFPSWREAFHTMILGVLADGERRTVDLGHPYASVRAVIDRHAAALDEVTEPRFVEWDMWDNNVLVRDGRIAAVIDHERALYGDPLIEAGFTGALLPAFGDATAFIRGYGHAPLNPAERTRRALYCLYLTLIMTIEPTFRQMDHENYVWARARLDEAMALF